MSGLGRLIRLLRENANLTREELSEGICSSKYIYLIERGDRMPAAKLMDELSTKLGVDLFDYNQYLDCEEPIEIKKVMDRMEMLRHNRELNELMIFNNNIKKMRDFSNASMRHEIEYNSLITDLFITKNYTEVMSGIINQIISLGGKIPICDKYLTPALSKFYNLYIIILFLMDDDTNGLSNCSTFYQMLHNVRFVKSYQELYISVTLNYINVLLKHGDVDRGFSIVESLNRFQSETKLMDRLHLSYFLMAKIEQLKKNQLLSEKYFIKFLYLGFALDKRTDITDLLGSNIYDTSKVCSPQILLILQSEGWM